MKFSDYKYERPDFTKVKDDLTALIEKFKIVLHQKNK